jgi:hypothetical protein
VRRLLLIVLVALLAPAGASASSRVAIFYYPWYGTPERDGVWQHWNQQGHLPPSDIAAAYYPARGIYSSSNPRVLAAQMADVAGAGVGEVVISWWGRFSAEDARLPVVAAAARARGLDVAVHLEPYRGRDAESVGADIGYLASLGVHDVYVYAPRDVSVAEWAALNSGLVGVRTFAQTTRVGFAAAGHFAGVYTYDVGRYGGWEFGRYCLQAHAKGLLCAPSVGPGYDAARCTGDRHRKPRRDGLTYDWMWQAAITAGADMVTITSYNEWGEGTQIEPARPQPAAGAYLSYDGAYGLHGRRASRGYLRRTACWTRVLAGRLPGCH